MWEITHACLGRGSRVAASHNTLPSHHHRHVDALSRRHRPALLLGLLLGDGHVLDLVVQLTQVVDGLLAAGLLEGLQGGQQGWKLR